MTPKRFLLLFTVFLASVITGWLFFGAYFAFIPNAHATGGAFPSTKHGGGTTDGVAPFGGGVNRGVNPDYSTGIYKIR
jgi:hypothetical protein